MIRDVRLMWTGSGPTVLLIFLLSLPAYGQPTDSRGEARGVISISDSPKARLHTVPVSAVRIGPGFWKDRMEINRKKSIPSLYQLLEENGIVDNFRRLSGRKEGPRRGPLYTDSDLYKWMEAAAWVLASGADPELQALLDRLTEELGAAQGPDGYLNSYYSLERAQDRFTNFQHGHELYCLGHLLQAGIAKSRATGKDDLLQVGRRYADYVVATLGPGRKAAFTGHPELEMAMVELFRTTGERRYLAFADYLLNAEKPEFKLSARDIAYAFSLMPITRRKILEGHSVRATYALCGAADYYLESGQESLLNILETMWSDMVRGKLYLTGGLGSRESGEAIGDAYELPNERAYTETCAAIGNMMWNWRMLQITAEARFADLCERTLYNAILPGVSWSGDAYFYRNPLASSGNLSRRNWYSTTCCPPNIQRTLASLPGYFLSTSKSGLWVHQYQNLELDWKLENGTPLQVQMETRYPWDGNIALVVKPRKATSFSLHLRIPGWCETAHYRLNGGKSLPVPVKGAEVGQYFMLDRAWQPGDRVELVLDMPIRLIQCNPAAAENLNRLAVFRGPILYCYEPVEPGQPSPVDLRLQTGILPQTRYQTRWDPELWGGTLLLQVPFRAVQPGHRDMPLYYPAREEGKPVKAALPPRTTLIPYFAWGNRGAAEMSVWLPRD